MEQTRSELKDKFKDGEIPTGTDFANLIDSFLNFEDDGMTSYQGSLPFPFKRFGIGDTAPECPLGIKGEDGGDDGMICFTSNDGSTKWNINLNPSPSDNPGFSIDDISSGSGFSRLFIQPETGYVGIGTFAPGEKLHVEDAVDVGYVSMQVRNISTFHDHPGFLLSHYGGDALTDPRDGAFGIVEKAPGGNVERVTVLAQFVSSGHNINNVGINEIMPYSTLHVSRPTDDPKLKINLNENTGIMLLGTIIGQNLGFDNSDIQARTGADVGGGVLGFTATPLGLQPLGGDITIHSSYTIDKQIKITDTGKIGVGKVAVESVDVNGAITIANAVDPGTSANGTIRWSGTDFEGRKDGSWVSLTHGSFTDGIWSQPGGAGTALIYFKPVDPGLYSKVGIGTDAPSKTLDIFNNENVEDASNTTVYIRTEAHVAGSSFSNSRIGLEITDNNTEWNTNPAARNVGIYVSNITGQSNHEANLAAVFNGNTVVGALAAGDSVIGENGRNVLAIQTGDAPNTAPGTTTSGGIQIYAENLDLSGTGVPDVSVAHLMNGDGTVMRFYQQGSIFPNNINTPNTGNPVTDKIISDTRQRVLDLENVLKNLGLLVP